MKLLIILMNFTIVLLFLVFLARFLERVWRQYQSEQAAKSKDSATTDATSVANRLTHWGAQLRAYLQLTPALSANAEMVTRFRDWVTRDLDNERELQSWLLTLPEAGITLLVNHIAAFCQELNFDLAWLLEQKVTVAPELKRAMEGAIIDYCNACRSAVPVQKQAKLFIEYQQLLKNDNSKATQALRRTLYANLAEQGLAPAPSAAFIAATEAERQQQTIATIEQVAAKDWPQFAQVFHATLTPNGVPLPSQNGHHRNGGSASSNGVAPVNKQNAQASS